MRLMTLYTCTDAGHAFGVCIRWLMQRSIAVVVWLQAMRLVSLYTRADAQSYGSTCMALAHAFGVCVFAG